MSFCEMLLAVSYLNKHIMVITYNKLISLLLYFPKLTSSNSATNRRYSNNYYEQSTSSHERREWRENCRKRLDTYRKLAARNKNACVPNYKEEYTKSHE